MNKKHYVIYFDEKTNQAITITSREWARKNKLYFQNYNFKDKQNNHPTTDEIVNFLE